MKHCFHVFIVPEIDVRKAGYERSDHFIGLQRLLSRCLEPVQRLFPELDLREAVDALVDRERLGPTAAGGVALPHANVLSLDQEGIILLCRFQDPVMWPDSMDSRAVKIALIGLVPVGAENVHRRIMTRLNRSILDLAKPGIQGVEFASHLKRELKGAIGVTGIELVGKV